MVELANANERTLQHEIWAALRGHLDREGRSLTFIIV